MLLVCAIKYQYPWVSLIYCIAIMESKLFSFPLKITKEVALSSECNTVQHKTLVNLELQENWWRKFWRLITLITVQY